jgi:anti-sigma factor RsiW
MTSPHPGDALHAYLDHELGAERSLEVREHLRACAACRREYQAARAVRGVVQRSLPAAPLAEDFERRLRRAVRDASPRPWSRRAAPWAASLAAASLVALLALWPARGPEGALVDEVVEAHLRSLLVDHLTDVASSDRHTVKPWFQGKVPFSLPVQDLSAQGFALEGGRLELLDGHPAAALVYRVRQHAVNAFAWPAEGTSAALVETRRGVHVWHRVAGALSWWLVSDAGPEELERLGALLVSPASPSPPGAPPR